MSAARLLTDVRSRPRNSSETDFAVGLVWLQHKPFRSRVRSQVGVSRHEHDQPVRVHLMWGVRTNVVSTVEISHRASCRSVFAAIPGRQDGRELSDPRRVRGIAPTRGVRTTEPGVIKPTELASPRGSSWPVVAILALELPVKLRAGTLCRRERSLVVAAICCADLLAAQKGSLLNNFTCQAQGAREQAFNPEPTNVFPFGTSGIEGRAD